MTMTTVETAPIVDRAELYARANAFGEFAARYDDQADRDRRLPDEVVDELRRTGLIRLVRPRRLGGLETDVTTYLEVLRQVAVHSASTAWVMQVLTIHEWFMTYTDPLLQQEIWGDDPDAIVVDAVAPTGRADAVDGGFTITGRWRFVSGVEWCDWAAVGAVAVLPDGDGTPEPCLFFMPRSEFDIADEWDTLGLRGTASNTVVGEDVFIPTHRVFPIRRVSSSGEPHRVRLDDGPLFHVPWGPFLSSCIFPVSIGLAQRAIRDFQAWTEKRVRPNEKPGTAWTGNPGAQILLAECAAQIDATHALALKYAAQLEQYAAEGHSALTATERAQLFAWRGYIARSCADVVDRLYREAGASAIFATHPLHRTFRDIHAAAAHASLAPADAMLSYGQTLFGGAGHHQF